MKTLYFEGAGMSFNTEENNLSNVGNHRIRTAFTNDEGKQIYIELGRCTRYRYTSLHGNKELKKPIVSSENALRIDHLHYITGGKDDDNNSRISFDWCNVRENFDYTKESIVAWINANLGCSFDTMEVLDDMEGYRVHTGTGRYNLMEDHKVNHERTAARIAAYNMIDQEYRKHCNSRYSVVSVAEMTDDTLKIRCYASDEKLAGKPRFITVNVWTKEVQ